MVELKKEAKRKLNDEELNMVTGGYGMSASEYDKKPYTQEEERLLVLNNPTSNIGLLDDFKNWSDKDEGLLGEFGKAPEDSFIWG